TRMPAPSAGTKPSRVASNGRLASSGGSFWVVITRMTQKLASPSSQIDPSVPPATMTSAAPRRITSAASPIAWFPAAQAVTTVELLDAAHARPTFEAGEPEVFGGQSSRRDRAEARYDHTAPVPSVGMRDEGWLGLGPGLLDNRLHLLFDERADIGFRVHPGAP